MTVKRNGEGRVGCLDDKDEADLGGGEPLDNGGVGNVGTSIPND
jgi:hypothetical protein